MISNLKSEKENQEYLKSVIGANKRNQIDWESGVGKEIEYEYDWKGRCSKGALKIIKYESRKIYFEGCEKGVRTRNLTRCELGGVLNFISFKYEIGVTINHLTIIDREYRRDKKDQKYKYYKYRCNACNNEDWIRESSLKGGQGCNVCSGQKVVLGINSILDKASWMVDLGVSEEDAKIHTPGSSKEIYIKCPDCGRIRKTTPKTVYHTHSIGCSCGDGISYPEKLIESVLIQVGIKYERQYKTDWSQNRVYDFYLPYYNIIIEAHGEQHYRYTGRGRSLKEEQENDKLKEELALKNGIKHYIVINCSKSELEYIKNNILDSELNELFDLSNNINWVQCEEYGLSNKVKEICDYYKNHPGISIGDLVKEFGMSRSAITKYLKQGAKINWCKYNAEEEKSISKPVSQFTIEGEFIKTYPSIMVAGKQIGIDRNSITKCCNGKLKTAGGYIWKYAN